MNNKLEEMTLFDQFKRKPDMKVFMISWLIYWEFMMGFYTLVLTHFDIDHLRNVHLTFAYFFTATLLSFFLFHTNKYYQIRSFHPKQLSLLWASVLFFYMTSYLVAYFIPMSTKAVDYIMEVKFYYPLLRFETISSKVIDLVFQQTLIVSLVLYLREKLETKKQVIALFTLLFFILHIPLFVIFGWFSLAYTIPSLGAGLIFSYFILNSKFGLLYSFLVHQFFYFIIAIYMRLK